MTPEELHPRRSALALSGVWVEGYIPLFHYLSGIAGAPRDAARQFALALATNDDIVVYRCAEAACRRPDLDRVWDGLGNEMGRIAKSTVSQVHVFSPSAPEIYAQVVASRIVMRAANRALGSLMPGKLKAIPYQMVIAIRRQNGADVFFGIPAVPHAPEVKLGFKVSSIASDLLPPLAKSLYSKYRTAEATLAIPPTDTAALESAAMIATQIARLALTTRG